MYDHSQQTNSFSNYITSLYFPISLTSSFQPPYVSTIQKHTTPPFISYSLCSPDFAKPSFILYELPKPCAHIYTNLHQNEISYLSFCGFNVLLIRYRSINTWLLG